MRAILQAIVSAGHSALMPDLYGTGDSEGDFADASIATWREDIDAVVKAIDGSGPLHVVALRAGSLLAVDAAQRHPVESLVLLQPIAEGRQQLNQWVRLRLAGGLVGSAKKETGGDLKQAWSRGEVIEIAGYGVSAAMATELESLGLGAELPEGVARAAWLELVANSERGLLPASERVIDRWREAGGVVHTQTLVCDSFWGTQEIAHCAALVDAVRALGDVP